VLKGLSVPAHGNLTAKTCDIVSATAGNRQRKREVYVKHIIRSCRKSVEGASILEKESRIRITGQEDK
jgi:hypothetical protein